MCACHAIPEIRLLSFTQCFVPAVTLNLESMLDGIKLLNNMEQVDYKARNKLSSGDVISALKDKEKQILGLNFIMSKDLSASENFN